MSKPTLKQMANRMHDGHYNALRHIRDGETASAPRTDAMALGRAKMMDTLRRWDAIETERVDRNHVGEYETRITDTGRALIDAYEARFRAVA